jgi:hypothetical protein
MARPLPRQSSLPARGPSFPIRQGGRGEVLSYFPFSSQRGLRGYGPSQGNGGRGGGGARGGRDFGEGVKTKTPSVRVPPSARPSPPRVRQAPGTGPGKAWTRSPPESRGILIKRWSTPARPRVVVRNWFSPDLLWRIEGEPIRSYPPGGGPYGLILVWVLSHANVCRADIGRLLETL